MVTGDMSYKTTSKITKLIPFPYTSFNFKIFLRIGTLIGTVFFLYLYLKGPHITLYAMLLVIIVIYLIIELLVRIYCILWLKFGYQEIKVVNSFLIVTAKIYRFSFYTKKINLRNVEELKLSHIEFNKYIIFKDLSIFLMLKSVHLCGGRIKVTYKDAYSRLKNYLFFNSTEKEAEICLQNIKRTME